MSDEKETKVSQDDLKQVAGGTPAAKELSLDELKQVTGGATADQLLKIDGIKGESQNEDHKDWVS